MSEFIFKPVTRAKMKLLLGFFGLSGGGKTLSALLVGRGIVGPNGKLGCADTENGRASVFLDMVPGGFLHLDFQPPFNPLAYCDVIEAAESQRVECLIIDSCSHEWLGQGGYLDLKEEALQRMAGDDWKKREKCAMAAAAQVKPKTHSKFIQRVLRSKMSIIMCFRAHPKVRLTKDASGSSKIEVDETPSPMQDGELIYEMMIAGECYSKDGIGGYFRTSGPHCKHSHPSILKLLPVEGEQIGEKHGQALARWCAGAAEPMQSKPTTNVAKLKKDLWDLTQSKHNGDAALLEQFLHDECLLDPQLTPGELNADQLSKVIAKTKEKLSR